MKLFKVEGADDVEVQEVNETIEIVTRLMNGELYIDDHSNNECKPEGLAITEKRMVCPIWWDKSFCLNPLYLDADGKIHLSKTSLGGTFVSGTIRRYGNVDDYNVGCGPKVASGRIRSVLWFYNYEVC